MKKVKLSWVKAPYLNSKYSGRPGESILLTFEQYVNNEIYDIVKYDWAGSIEKDGKKISLYQGGVIARLITNGYCVDLEGSIINNFNNYESFPSLSAYILVKSINSNNSYIKQIAQLYNIKKNGIIY